MNNLINSIKENKPVVLYGLTPPKQNNSKEKIISITELRKKRLSPLNLDGLVVYDIQDETSRISDDRPFPFLPTINSIEYTNKYLCNFQIPKVIYICAGKYTADSFRDVIKELRDVIIVLVGAPSKSETVSLSLKTAYKIVEEFKEKNNILLGGVTIAERHHKKNDEQYRIISKIQKGCDFFISQCVFDIEYAKNLFSDYYYECIKKDIQLKPIILTFTPCGSDKTLQLLEWLGIKVPKWISNDLMNGNNTLEQSMEICLNNFKEILNFAQGKNIPLGINVESVAINKDEIIASIELAQKISSLLKYTI